jgi:sigma-E factor negative regulatory protein RseA
MMMTESKLEQLSAWMDDDLPKVDAEELITMLERDDELKAAWVRFHVIGEALRANLPDVARRDFSMQVSRALEREPTVIAPPKRRWATHIPLALAAGIAGLAVLVVWQFQHDEPLSGKMYEQAAKDIGKLTPLPQIDISVSPQSTEQAIYSYILNHNQYNPSIDRGVQSYARLFGDDKKP